MRQGELRGDSLALNGKKARAKQAVEARRRARHTDAERRTQRRRERAREAEHSLLVSGHWLLRSKAPWQLDPARSTVGGEMRSTPASHGGRGSGRED